MSLRLASPPRGSMALTVAVGIALVVGTAVTLASSPASLTGRQSYSGIAAADVMASPATPAPSPSPPPPEIVAGALGRNARLMLSATSALIGAAPTLATVSTDGGKTWTTIQPPEAGGIAVDEANPRHAVGGGAKLQVTFDGGATWTGTRSSAPGAGPYLPLQVSPFDPGVWFVIHEQKLLRTRDGSATWRDLSGLPPMTAPVMVPGPFAGQFFLASGGRVFDLLDNGQQILELPTLPQGASLTALAVIGGNPVSLLARGDGESAFLLKDGAWSVAAAGVHGPVAVGANGVLLIGDGAGRAGSPGSVFFSGDAGATWAQATGLPQDQSVDTIAARASSTSLFAYCFGGDIYTSIDGGRTWALLSKALRPPAVK